MKKIIFILFFIFFFTLPLLAQSFPDSAWVRRYNGPGDTADYAHAIAVDNSGNVYVTGYSFGSRTSIDYATIKYYPNGDTAWVRRYNPGLATALALDGTGNVYVTGYSNTIGSSLDYTTIKYYPDGDTAWVRRYNGPGNYDDLAGSISIDVQGNVYVTGYSYGGSGTSYDYATIKYYPNGNTAWVRRYNGPGNSVDQATRIAVDGNGNVYVTGFSDQNSSDPNNYDYATIKYYPNGDTAWVRRYNGPRNDWDQALAIALDGDGNAYVTGKSIGSSWDYLTIKYYPNGDTAWVRRFNGTGNNVDQAFAIAVDGPGNVYVTGYSGTTGSYYDYATIKYNPNGDTTWVRTYYGQGPGNYDDYATSVALDGSGNVYVTGYSLGSGTSYDYATIKYYPNGDTAWVRRYDGPANSDDRASSVIVPCFGNVYVTGYSYGSGTYADYATIKYNQFKRGDANADGQVTVSDVVYLIAYLYKGGPPPSPLEKGDVNCDCIVDAGDVNYIVNYLFKSGPQPC